MTVKAPIRVLIVDDEPLARRRLRTLLQKATDVEIIGDAANGAEAVDIIQNSNLDLVFLDVQMPEMDGFCVIDAVGVERMPYVIFVSAYDQHALRAFEVGALDFILKPFEFTRLEIALERARRQLRLCCRLEKFQKRFRSLLQKVDDILWLEAADDYVNVHTAQESFLILCSLAEIEEHLDPRCFARAHQTCFVRREAIQEIIPWTNGRLKVRLMGGQEIMTSRSGAQRLKKRMA
jgi:two-component system LytT family response regulator